MFDAAPASQEKEHHFYYEVFRADGVDELIPASVKSAPPPVPPPVPPADARVKALEVALAEKESAESEAVARVKALEAALAEKAAALAEKESALAEKQTMMERAIAEKDQELAEKEVEKERAIASLTAQKQRGSRFWPCFTRTKPGTNTQASHELV